MEWIDEEMIGEGVHRWLSYETRHEPPYSAEELGAIEMLIVHKEENWDVLKYCHGITSLTIETSQFPSLEPLETLSKLERLEVTQSTLRDLSNIGLFSALHVATLDFNLIEDASPLLELEGICSIGLSGNPLSEKSYYEVVPALREDGKGVYVDDEEIWRLCRDIHERDPRAVYGSLRRRTHLVVPELQLEYYKRGILGNSDKIESTPEPQVVREALEKDDFDAVELALEHWDRPYRYVDHITFEETSKLSEYIEKSGLDDELAKSLSWLWERIGAGQFVLEDDEVVGQLSDRLYYWKSFPRPKRPDLPQWLKEYRRTAAYPGEDGEPMGLRFSQEAPSKIAGECISLRSPGIRGSGQGVLVDHLRLYPVAWGPKSQWCLAIPLGESKERPVFFVEKQHLFEWDYEPDRIFDDWTKMLDSIEEAVAWDELDEPPSNTPPSGPNWDFGYQVGVERGDADKALEWIEESELDTEFKDALRQVIEAFPKVLFVRENEARMQYRERLNGARFPKWIRDLRKTLAWVEDDEQKPLMWKAGTLGPPDTDWYTMNCGAGGDDHHFMINEIEMLPVAQGPYKDLLVDLRDPDNRALYVLDRQIDRETGTRPRKKLYSNAAAFFRGVRGLTDAAGNQLYSV